eukprot:Lithocolla_globosa_v1_NODE_367_length_4285_cov_70.186525.p1 type:complete len:635 gc:universal NODE_367_length_4285_cov_70.186525:1647-3551(+)
MKTFYDIKNYSSTDFKKELKKVKFSTILKRKDPGMAFTEFTNLFTPIAQKHIPLKTCTPNHRKEMSRKPWISAALVKEIEKQHKLYENSIKNPGKPEAERNHKKHRNHVRKELRKPKRSAFINCSPPTFTTQIISNILNKTHNKQVHPKQLVVKRGDNNEIITNQKEMANTFNTFFTTVAADLVKNIELEIAKDKNKPITFAEYLDKNKKTCFRFTRTDHKTVEKLLAKLDVTKAIGVDHIHTRTLVDSADIIAPYITYILNLCFKNGIFPQDLKPARVTPVYKKQNPFTVSNYRPVSILITLSKIFEREMLNQMMIFLLDNNIISKRQYGFLKNTSTSTALINFYEELLQILDEKGMAGIGTLIDLSKAFDTVNHSILLSKLELYGIGGKSLDLLKSYLSNRTQIVIVDNSKSDPMKITCGVPQGSILGSLLFILYINDLPNALTHSQPLMFADDTTLLATHSNITQLQKNALEDLNSVSIWCKANLLTLNTSKTAYLLFSGANKQIPDSFSTKNLPPNPPQKTTKITTKSTKKKGSSKIVTETHTESTNVTLTITQQKITQTVTTASPEGTEIITTEPYTITTNTNPLNLTINGNHIFMEEKTKFLGQRKLEMACTSKNDSRQNLKVYWYIC